MLQLLVKLFSKSKIIILDIEILSLHESIYLLDIYT